jgi:Ran GTPase-activating protein (RanGAP) involved in mRNA processing and transport
MGDDGATHLGAAMANCVKLSHLDVRDNYICADGARALASGACEELTYFDLSRNSLGDAGY